MVFLSTRAFLVLNIFMGVAIHCTAAVIHYVGDSSGWHVPSGNSFYDTWAAHTTLKVGDTLVFNFSTNAHNVLRVTQGDYKSCTGTSPLTTYTTGPATVNLTQSGPRYYICGFPGDCTAGQKVAITVSAGSEGSKASPLKSPPTIQVTISAVAPTMYVTASSSPTPPSSPRYVTASSPPTSVTVSSSPIISRTALSAPTPSSSPLQSTFPWPSFETPSPLQSPFPLPSFETPSPLQSPFPWPSFETPSPLQSPLSSYIVGGSNGWTVPSSNNLYNNWAANITFKVGDSLVFNFVTNTHNVLQVTQANYNSCTATSPLKSYTTGPATVHLTESGAHYYICGISGHCSGGQKLAIRVSGKPLHKKKWNSLIEAAIGVASGVFVISIIIFICIRINRKKRELQEEEEDMRGYMDPLDSRPPTVENCLHAGIPTRYSYRQIKGYTKKFSERLGQGGFGTVFKGELPNGCMIAVKILDKSKHSRIQFMNEVATIGRIHHLHLVQLLGYCFEGSKRALIYEYMVNGSLEKYIHGDDQNALNWKQLYFIAIGTARGLAYLHDDCRNKILHCDIKPHNVLLDANFSPKVADFGLAKLADRAESHVSLTGARGTPGYVAPEVWSRSNGPVTDRSDVYSYGMLVMEMVGGRKNFDMKATRSSKFYYPEWAFKQVEMGEFRKLREENIADGEDEVIAKKLSMLGLWCIQYSPSQRPSMSSVIQMLEGTVDIAMPPQPFPVNTSVQIEASTESSSLM